MTCAKNRCPTQPSTLVPCPAWRQSGMPAPLYKHSATTGIVFRRPFTGNNQNTTNTHAPLKSIARAASTQCTQARGKKESVLYIHTHRPYPCTCTHTPARQARVSPRSGAPRPPAPPPESCRGSGAARTATTAAARRRGRDTARAGSSRSS